MFLGDFFEAHYQRAKPCFGLRRLQRNVGRAVPKVVGNRRKNGHSSRALPALTFSAKCARKSAPKGPVWGPLGPLLSLWRLTWSPKGTQSRQKGRPTEPLESALGTRGARMLPNAARGCPGPRKWSPQDSKRELKSQKKHSSRNLIQINATQRDPARNTA